MKSTIRQLVREEIARMRDNKSYIYETVSECYVVYYTKNNVDYFVTELKSVKAAKMFITKNSSKYFSIPGVDSLGWMTQSEWSLYHQKYAKIHTH